MTRRERDKRRRVRRSIKILAALCLALIAVIALRITNTKPEQDTKTAQAVAIYTSAIPGTQITAERYEAETAGIPTPAEETEATPQPVSRYADLDISEHDIEILAALVYHEARGECFDGQVAVAEVVLNRCLSGYAYFPDTVEDVVFQKTGDTWQFSPAPYLWTAEPTETQYNAVDTAINSASNVLPVNAVFFSGAPYNENVVATIDNHYFCSVEEVAQ